MPCVMRTDRTPGVVSTISRAMRYAEANCSAVPSWTSMRATSSTTSGDTGRLRWVTVAYAAATARYDSMTYRRCGRSGLLLPVVSLGLWHNFGDDKPLEVQQAIMRRAFDLGVTHFDLANNYGPPYGAAERNFGGH